ncbi:uncharacterized protein IWZ02DRAFT_439044 [Phyllosticta citriasiana]|uniref:uncharacterized protein n=1 Tax=Phyllosticta citriasiana TaxID=595635 RepID=UPI0030FD362F
MPSRPCEAARRTTIFATSSKRSFSIICRHHGPFNVKAEQHVRPPRKADSDALKIRSTPEVTSPIWHIPPFQFSRIKLPDGPKPKLSLSYARNKAPTLFHNHYEAAYKLGYVGNEILANTEHPLHIRLRRKYDAREKGCLWWAATMFVKSSPKRFIRDEMNRHLRAAFRAALAERGLDEHGRKVVNGKAESLGAIQGTFRMVGKPEMFRAKPEDLKKEALWAVDALLQMFENRSDRPQTQRQSRPRQSHRRNP